MGECLIIKSGGVDTSDANATSDKVLQGYTCYVNDVLITGTIIRYDKAENQDTTLAASSIDSRPVILAIAADQIWLLNNKDTALRLCLAIPKNGYYSNHTFVGIDYSKFAHKLILDNLTTGANAIPTSIYQGIVGYVNGQRIVGTMPDRGATSYTLPINTTYWIPNGLHNGNGYVNQIITLQGGWTITPGVNTIMACNAGRYTTGDIWCAGDGNLVPWNIRNGYNIFGVTGTFSGWVDGWVSWDAPGIGGTRTVFINWEVNSYDHDMKPIFKVVFKRPQLINLQNQGFTSMRLDCSVSLCPTNYKSYAYSIRANLPGNPILQSYSAPAGSGWKEYLGTTTYPLQTMINHLLNDVWEGGLNITNGYNSYGDTIGRSLKALLNWANLWVCK